MSIKELDNNKIIIFLLIISGIATTGSLYLSLGLGLFPCKYCWYQRILMYPLVIISIIGIYENEYYEKIYLVFSILGSIIAGYHSLIQMIPHDGGICTSGCSVVQYSVGIFTIPNLSFIAFIIILGTVLIKKYTEII